MPEQQVTAISRPSVTVARASTGGQSVESVQQQSVSVVRPSVVIGRSSPIAQIVAARSSAGLPGRDGIGSGGSLLKMAFAWGDASPKPIYSVQAGQVIFTASIVVIEPFNGVGAALRLGDVEQSDRLQSADQNDPTAAAEYECNPGLLYGAPGQILLTITPGEGCSQGRGYVLLEV